VAIAAIYGAVNDGDEITTMEVNKLTIPIDVVPDEEFNKRWLTQPDGSWRGYAPGTQTEAKRQGLADEAYKKEALAAEATKFEEEKRARSLAEALAQKNYDLSEKETNYNINKPYYSGDSGGGITPYQMLTMLNNQKQDDVKSVQWILNEAANRAKSDSRRAGTISVEDPEDPTRTVKKVVQADGVNYFTDAQLVDAWTRQLADQFGVVISGVNDKKTDTSTASALSDATASWATRKYRDDPNKAQNW